MLSLNKSLIIFPNIKGITIRKENLADCFLLFTRGNDVKIVAPDLEIPGIIAKA